MRVSTYAHKKQRVARFVRTGERSPILVRPRKVIDGCVEFMPMRALAVGLAMLLVVGCAGLWKRAPSDRELVTQVMHQWVQGWASLDADLLEPLVSEIYYGANGENKGELLYHVRLWKQNPDNYATMVLGGMTVELSEGQASVRGVRADIHVKEWDIISEYKLDYFLRKEEGVWRIVGAALAG